MSTTVNFPGPSNWHKEKENLGAVSDFACTIHFFSRFSRKHDTVAIIQA
jgi:hypothetical protein